MGKTKKILVAFVVAIVTAFCFAGCNANTDELQRRIEELESQLQVRDEKMAQLEESLENELQDGSIDFFNPFLSFENEEILEKRLTEEFLHRYHIPKEEISFAVKKAWKELETVREDMMRKGEETLEFLRKTGRHGIVLAGRPYHMDPEINHGIPELINSYGMAVLTEDSVSHLYKVERPLLVTDQWMYHSRLYAAAGFVKTRDDLDLIQLNSFGCGLDAVTTDQVSDILSNSGKIYTCLKIDEVNSLGAARIRIRSLISAIRVREQKNQCRCIVSSAHHRVVFTEEMKKTHTILCPQMSPIHFDIIEPAFRSCGYHLELLPDSDKSAIDMGLKYVNNDACYPSLVVVGQIMTAVFSGTYDPERLAVIVTQTGGGCRATNYIGFIRRALAKAGYPEIPVISLNLSGLEANPGFRLTPELVIKSMYGLAFGDIFLRVLYRMRPYEKVPGSADALHEKWKQACRDFVSQKHVSRRRFARICREIVEDFDRLPIDETLKKPRVGVVGEILVKFSPSANNHIVDLLESEGAEAVVPDLMDFLLYCFKNNEFKADYLGKKRSGARMGRLGIRTLEWLRRPAVKALQRSVHFSPPGNIDTMADAASSIVSLGNQTGEGWFLTAEMLELIHMDVPNIVCTQPFGCLPNHVVGKGVIKELRRQYPQSNIVAIDYDPGASEVNQVNRLKLMLAAANKKLREENDT